MGDFVNLPDLIDTRDTKKQWNYVGRSFEEFVDITNRELNKMRILDEKYTG